MHQRQQHSKSPTFLASLRVPEQATNDSLALANFIRATLKEGWLCEAEAVPYLYQQMQGIFRQAQRDKNDKMIQLGRLVIVMGAFLILLGIILTMGPRLPFQIGRLPLDLHLQRDNFSFYFPLGTSIVFSILLSIVFLLFGRR